MANKPSLDSFWENPYEAASDFPTLNPSKGLAMPSPSRLPGLGGQPEQPQKKSFLEGAIDTGKNVIGAIAKPFVNLAAAPVQGAAKLMGQPDPYSNFSESIGLPNVNPTSIDKPLTKVGSAGEIASYAFPYGRFFQLGKLAGVGGGVAGGYGVDVSTGLASGEDFPSALKPGLGTALGGGLAAAGPVSNTIGRLIGETLGVSTGTGFGAIKQAFEAGEKGGKAVEAFTSALRGKVSPDAIVQEAKDALSTIVQNRRQDYQQSLETIAENKTLLDISPIVKELQTQLTKFGVQTSGRMLDFSRSAIRFDKTAQKTIQTIFDEVRLFGSQAGDRTPIQVDSLKRALGDLYSESSNVRAFVQALKGTTRDVLEQVQGYGKLSKDYAEKSGLIDEIQRGLSLGDQAMIDSTFKKLITSLRLNNDQRREMIETLEGVSNGQLLPKIAGQQMSEWLPRGIMRPLGGGIAVAGAASGFILPLLKFAAFASPRMVGESLKTLGFSKSEMERFIQAIGGIETLMRGVSPAVQSARPQASPQAQPPAARPEDAKNQLPPLESFQ